MARHKLSRTDRPNTRHGLARKGLSALALVASAFGAADTAEAQQSYVPPQPGAVFQEGYAEEIDPLTLEPVFQGPVGPNGYQHPIVESWKTGRTPRKPIEFRKALKDSFSGFYGGVDYVHYRVSGPNNAFFGNIDDLPDFNDPILGGYVDLFRIPGIGGAVGAQSNGIPQPLTGLLNPGGTVEQGPADIAQLAETYIFGRSPFADPTLVFVDTATAIAGEPQVINLILGDYSESFDGLQGARVNVGYAFAGGVRAEVNAFGTGESTNRLEVAQGLTADDSSIIRAIVGPTFPVVPGPTLGINIDNFSGPALTISRNAVYVPIVITDMVLDLPFDGVTDIPAPVIPPAVLPVVSTPDLDGNRADLTNPLIPLYFDGALASDYTVDVHGADFNLLVPVTKGQHRWRFDVSLGARFLDVDEKIRPGFTFTDQSGITRTVTAVQTRPFTNPLDRTNPDFSSPVGAINTFDDVSGFAEVGDPRNFVLNVDNDNHLYAAQLGFRTELDVTDWLTIGVAPQLALGVNDVSTTVTAAELLFAGDPTVTTRDNDSQFAAIFDLGVYAKWHLRDWLTARVGYHMMRASGVARAPERIDWRTSFANPGLGIRESDQTLTVDGLNVGVEVLLP